MPITDGVPDARLTETRQLIPELTRGCKAGVGERRQKPTGGRRRAAHPGAVET